MSDGFLIGRDSAVCAAGSFETFGQQLQSADEVWQVRVTVGLGKMAQVRRGFLGGGQGLLATLGGFELHGQQWQAGSEFRTVAGVLCALRQRSQSLDGVRGDNQCLGGARARLLLQQQGD